MQQFCVQQLKFFSAHFARRLLATPAFKFVAPLWSVYSPKNN